MARTSINARQANQLTISNTQERVSDDEHATIGELRALVARFVAERDWEQFHTPKNLAMSITIESAELMEHFQWRTAEQSAAVLQTPEIRQEIEEELADVLSYVLAFANATGIDLYSAVAKKMDKNALKYPVEEFRGRFGAGDT